MPATIEFVCPNCFRPYSAPADVAGRGMSCAGCAAPFVIPAPPRPAPAVVEYRPEPEPEEPDYRAATAPGRRLRARRARRAKVMFFVKLGAILACLVAIVLLLRAGAERVRAYEAQQRGKAGAAPTRESGWAAPASRLGA